MNAEQTAKILDGRYLSKKIREGLKYRVDALHEKGVFPKLAVFVASDDYASQAYVRMKQKWAEKIGIRVVVFEVVNTTTQNWLIENIKNINSDQSFHGILIQHPLPKHLDEQSALWEMGPKKDVDGISPQSLGRLLCGLPGFRCATPYGMMRLLDEYGIECSRKHAVVLGRSVILGKPAALMLLERNATVTICHSKTENIEDICKQADILVAAVGRPEMVKPHWIKPGAIVLDAGYNKLEGRNTDVGDVDFENVSKVAGWITPVPGGVGPMTVAMLLSNVVQSAENA